MNLPGHNYIGPGNPSENGKPVDTDDEIALEHDLDYDNAKSSEDVRTADKKAIKNFVKDAYENKNWHSGVGASGLAVKFGVELATGILYPVVPDGTTKKVAESPRVQHAKETIHSFVDPVKEKMHTLVDEEKIEEFKKSVSDFVEPIKESMHHAPEGDAWTLEGFKKNVSDFVKPFFDRNQEK